jgi:hypothetical protein
MLVPEKTQRPAIVNEQTDAGSKQEPQKQQQQQPQGGSGEGAASALAHMRRQERAKADEEPGGGPHGSSIS